MTTLSTNDESLPDGEAGPALPDVPRPRDEEAGPELPSPPAPAGDAGTDDPEAETFPFLTTPEVTSRRESVWSTEITRDHVRRMLLGALGALLVVQVGLVSYELGERASALRPVVLPASTDAAESLAERVYGQSAESVVSISVASGGSGTGFFYQPNRILTNAHVVAAGPNGAVFRTAAVGTEVDVLLSDGRERTGTVTGVDSRLDLAVVEVEGAEDVRPLAFADAENARPGQRVVVIGNPLGLLSSVSQGIVSAPRRITTFREDPVQAHLIQTDAAVNPGNSGGPLLDEENKVLGIVTIRPDSVEGRSVNGVAFAIPADAALASLAQLEEDGEVEYVLVGIAGRTANPEDRTKGMVVEEVTPGGGAEDAGIQVGDVVTEFDGVQVESYEDLTARILGKQPGDVVDLVVDRDGRDVALSLELQERRPGS